MHLIEKILHLKVDVFRNDEIELSEIEKYDKIVLSPGPGIPSEAGLLIPLIKAYAATKPILGICLGHQAIAEAFGGTLINLDTVYHGIATPVQIIEQEQKIFKGLPETIIAGRYHSWIADKATLPESLVVTAIDENGYIMAMKHKSLDVTGLQFHPESVLTPDGETIITNWLKN